jgi:hypothetical protein
MPNATGGHWTAQERAHNINELSQVFDSNVRLGDIVYQYDLVCSLIKEVHDLPVTKLENNSRKK